MDANGDGEWLDDELASEADEDGEWLDDELASEADEDGEGMDDELAMEADEDGEGMDDELAMEADEDGEGMDDELALEADEDGEGNQALVRRKGPPDYEEVMKASMGNPALYLSFLCLPAQEIARCRGFCKLWRDITSTDVFRRHHHDHHFRTPMPLFFFLDPNLKRLNLSAADMRNRVARPVHRFARPANHEVFRVHGSCDGILLLSSGRRLYACNPCTRRWARLPELHVDHDIIGFYVTPGPGEYKVLYHDRMKSGCAYWIFTLGTAAQQCIGRPAPNILYHELDPVLAKGIVSSYKIPPVFSCGFLHWLPKATQDNTNVLMFEIRAEVFYLVPPPPVVGRQLFEIDERVAMTAISFSEARVHVWVESDDTTEHWRSRYSIHVPVDEINHNNSCHHNGSVFAVAQDRQCLVQCPRVLLQCDDQGAVLQRYRYQHNGKEYWTALSGHTFQESLLLHPAILPMRDTDAVDGDPPFF